MKYLLKRNKRTPPQTEPLVGQTQNSAGGYSWEINIWTQLRRFLILGSEGGTYYISENRLTLENAKAVEKCVNTDGRRVVKEIVEISGQGRAPKNDPALFALALCAGLGDDKTRREALANLPKVARIGTHLFHFAAYVEGFRGWGRGLRTAISKWYEEKSAKELAFQLVKYRQRDGWSHRDLLRLAHPKTEEPTRNALYHWAVDGWDSVGNEPHPDEVLRIIWAFERLQRSENPQEAAQLIREYKLPMEAVPTTLRNKEVWEAVIEHSGLTFLIRNLGNLSKEGILTKSNKTEVSEIEKRIRDSKALQDARLHPIQILAALMTYQQGHGIRGSGTWEPVPRIIDALDEAFYLSFGNIEPSGKRLVLALDVSGSMAIGNIAGVAGLTPRVASAAMAMLAVRAEQDVEILAFCDRLVPLNITKKQRLDDVVKAISGLPFGGTDCALPMIWAEEKRYPADGFIVYTDSETWAGDIHPSMALKKYRNSLSIPARLCVVGMVANKFSIADPEDAGMLDVVGFDTATPELISQFMQGNI